MSHYEAEDFFHRYEAAFNRLDGDAVAALWHDASGIAHTHEAVPQITWWPEPAAMRANHLALCDHYRQAGYARAEHGIEAHVDLGPDHHFARVGWTLWRADGSLLQRFRTGYQLIRTPGGPKVLLATAFEENLRAMRVDA